MRTIHRNSLMKMVVWEKLMMPLAKMKMNMRLWNVTSIFSSDSNKLNFSGAAESETYKNALGMWGDNFTNHFAGLMWRSVLKDFTLSILAGFDFCRFINLPISLFFSFLFRNPKFEFHNPELKLTLPKSKLKQPSKMEKRSFLSVRKNSLNNTAHWCCFTTVA